MSLTHSIQERDRWAPEPVFMVENLPYLIVAKAENIFNFIQAISLHQQHQVESQTLGKIWFVNLLWHAQHIEGGGGEAPPTPKQFDY